MRRIGFSLAVFLSAFLLFQVQPIVGKAITPAFGGSAMVWTTCMLFFQAALLGGYLYAHVISGWSYLWQATLHVALLLTSLLGVNLIPSVRTEDASSPVPLLFTTLSRSIGPAFVLLGASAPLLQKWFNAVFNESPYRLYALSNAGSLLGLLSYPFVVEPYSSLQAQNRFWTLGFLAMAVLFALLSATLPKGGEPALQRREDSTTTGSGQPRLSQYVVWLLLAAAPSALLLAVTNKISVEIAPFPLLWVVPLSLYLVTFIVSFDQEGWYRPRTYLPCAIAGIFVVGALLRQHSPSILWLAGSLYAAMFFCSLLCHGELAQTKPEPQALTGYFLTISAGGMLGGIAVALGAPWVFRSYLELPLAYASCLILFVAVRARRRSPDHAVSWPTDLAVAVAGGLACALWSSPELASAAHLPMGRLGLSPVTRIPEFAAAIPAVALALMWLLSIAGGKCNLKTAGHGDGPSTRSGVLVSGLIAVGVLSAVSVALMTSLEVGFIAYGPVFDGHPGSASTMANPLTLWFIGFVIYSFSRSLPVSQSTSLQPAQQSGLTAYDVTSPWMLAAFATIGAAIATRSLVETLVLGAASNWQVLLLVAAAPMFTPVCRGMSLAIRRLLCAIVMVIALLPSLLQWFAISVRYGSAGSLAISSALAAGCLALAAGEGRHRWFAAGGLCIGLLLGLGAPSGIAVFLPAACAGLAALELVRQYERRPFALVPMMTGTAMVCLVGASCGAVAGERGASRLIAACRNFYGLLRVEESDSPTPRRVFMHGTVTHGQQLLDEAGSRQTSLYYHRESGIGLLLDSQTERPKEVAVIGLGVGTLAAYGRPGDRFRFFEIDPDVVAIAGDHFDFLESSPAQMDVVVADGRLALERRPGVYDILIADAFSGDAVPTHLLTSEAIDLYFQRLSPLGFLALNVSNTHLDLTPVVNGHARRLGLHLVYVDYNVPSRHPRSLWAILSRREIPVVGTSDSDAISEHAIDWTDHRHSLLPLIRLRR